MNSEELGSQPTVALTKREHIAIEAMNGLLSNVSQVSYDVPTKAVELADELLRELCKTKSQGYADD